MGDVLVGSSRQYGFLVPSLRDALAVGAPLDGLALSSALWMRYCIGKRDDGSLIEPNDPNWDALQAVAQQAQPEPMTWFEQMQYYGDLGAQTRFAEAYCKWAERKEKDGVAGVLDAFNSGQA